MKRVTLLWRIVGLLLLTLGIVGIPTIANWMSGVDLEMPEQAFFLAIPIGGYITCGIVIIIGIITLGGWFWNRYPTIIILYTLSFLIGLASIIGCYITNNDNAFKMVLSIIGMSIVILTTLTILLKIYSARNTRKQWKIFITLSILTVYLTLMIGFIFPQWLDTVALSFPDPVLREEIRKEIGKPFGFTTQSDLGKITSLVIWGYDSPKATRLDGLEKCTGLRELTLGWSWRVEDITPLSNLTNLQYLQITYYYDLNDITPLANLTQLRQLKLGSDSITNVSSLSNLINLSVLDLSSNTIEYINPLTSLTNLSNLDLSFNTIEDITPLASLTNLSDLDLGWNQVKDLSALSSLSRLTNLDIASNPCSDITPLIQLTNLNSLGIYLCNVSDISPLLNNTGLGAGDFIALTGDESADYNHKAHLDNYSRSVVVPELRARGITVYW